MFHGISQHQCVSSPAIQSVRVYIFGPKVIPSNPHKTLALDIRRRPHGSCCGLDYHAQPKVALYSQTSSKRSCVCNLEQGRDQEFSANIFSASRMHCGRVDLSAQSRPSNSAADYHPATHCPGNLHWPSYSLHIGSSRRRNAHNCATPGKQQLPTSSDQRRTAELKQ